MGIYIFIIIFIIFSGIIIKPVKSIKRKKIFIFLNFGIITLVAAIRNITVGVDTAQFCHAFDIISHMSWKNAFNIRYEDGFIFLCKILSYISTNRQILIIVSSLITFPIMGIFIYKNSKDVTLCTLLYVILNIYAMHMNVMRQALSIAIILVAYEMFFKKNKLIRYSIAVLISSLFHQASIVMLILVILKNKKYTINTYYITLAVGIVVLLISKNIWNIAVVIFPNYAGYANTEYINTSYLAGTISAIIALLVLTIGIFIERKNKEKNDMYHLFAYLMSILFIIDMLVIKINLFVRIATYFGPFTCIWLSNTSTNIKNKDEKLVIKFLIILCFMIYWIVISVYRPEWYGVIPYTTFLKS